MPFTSSIESRSTTSDELDVVVTQVMGVIAGARSQRPIAPNLETNDARAAGMPSEIACYAILRPLGRGGMGVVYDVRHCGTGARFALKTVNARTRDAAATLQREIAALATIAHRGVVRMHANGHFRGLPFFTMELVPGPRLARAFPRVLSEKPGDRSRIRALTVLRRVASTLAHLHAARIVHGDVTPSNVLVRDFDEPVLIDFGSSTSFSPTLPHERSSRDGRAVGTLAYMAPEQIRNEEVDGRADLYSFGCILYEMLTGRPPFSGRHRATVLRQHLEATPCPPSLLGPGIPTELDQLTLRLLAKKPAQRIEHAEEIEMVLGSLGAEDWPRGRRGASLLGAPPTHSYCQTERERRWRTKENRDCAGVRRPFAASKRRGARTKVSAFAGR